MKRNYNLDLTRIAACVAILVLHIFGVCLLKKKLSQDFTKSSKYIPILDYIMQYQ